MTTTQLGYISSIIVGLGCFLASLWLVGHGDTQNALYWLLVALYMRVRSSHE